MSQVMNAIPEQPRPDRRRVLAALAVVALVSAVSAYKLERAAAAAPPPARVSSPTASPAS